MSRIHISSFYRFKEINNTDDLRNKLLALCKKLNLFGTILISKEGFNGSIAGKKKSILEVFDYLQRELNLNANISDNARWNNTKIAPFKKLHVKIKNEIVALGREDINRANFAREILSQAGEETIVTDVLSSTFQPNADRPLNSRLDCSKTFDTFGIERPDWKHGLHNVLCRLGVI